MQKKKILAFLLLGVFALGLSACARQAAQEKSGDFPPNYEQYHALIGKERDAVYDSLSLEDKDLQDMGTGLYVLPEKEEYLGYPFKILLSFDVKSDQLLEFWYALEYQNEPENAAKAAGDLLDRMTKLYGEPDTYPGLQNRLKGRTDLAGSFSSEKAFSVSETWKMDAPEDFILELRADSDENSAVSISLRYVISRDRNREGGSPQKAE